MSPALFLEKFDTRFLRQNFLIFYSSVGWIFIFGPSDAPSDYFNFV